MLETISQLYSEMSILIGVCMSMMYTVLSFGYNAMLMGVIMDVCDCVLDVAVPSILCEMCQRPTLKHADVMALYVYGRL